MASLDDEILRFVAAHRTPALTTVAEAVQTAGDSRQVLWLLGTAGLAMLPLDGWALPSGHAARVAAVSLAVLVAASWSASGERRAQALALAWTVGVVNVAIGAVMVYLGAHWPTDVLAGWALGAGVGWTAGRLARVRARARTPGGP